MMMDASAAFSTRGVEEDAIIQIRQAVAAERGFGRGREEYFDRYGFRRGNDGAAAQLAASTSEARERRQEGKWEAVRDIATSGSTSSMSRRLMHLTRGDPKKLCRLGIPYDLRKHVWWQACGARTKSHHSPRNYYTLLSGVALSINNEKMRDAHRYVSEGILSPLMDHPNLQPGGLGMEVVRRIVCSVLAHNDRVDFFPELVKISAFLVVIMEDEERAFWLTLYVVEDLWSPGMYRNDSVVGKLESELLGMVLQQTSPRVAKHINALGLLQGSIMKHWMRSLLLGNAPIETVARVWDAVLYEGLKAFYRIIVGFVLKYKEKLMLSNSRTEAERVMMESLEKAFDRDGLMRQAIGKVRLSRDQIMEMRSRLDVDHLNDDDFYVPSVKEMEGRIQGATKVSVGVAPLVGATSLSAFSPSDSPSTSSIPPSRISSRATTPGGLRSGLSTPGVVDLVPRPPTANASATPRRLNIIGRRNYYSDRPHSALSGGRQGMLRPVESISSPPMMDVEDEAAAAAAAPRRTLHFDMDIVPRPPTAGLRIDVENLRSESSRSNYGSEEEERDERIPTSFSDAHSEGDVQVLRIDGPSVSAPGYSNADDAYHFQDPKEIERKEKELEEKSSILVQMRQLNLQMRDELKSPARPRRRKASRGGSAESTSSSAPKLKFVTDIMMKHASSLERVGEGEVVDILPSPPKSRPGTRPRRGSVDMRPTSAPVRNR